MFGQKNYKTLSEINEINKRMKCRDMNISDLFILTDKEIFSWFLRKPTGRFLWEESEQRHK